MKVWLLKAGLLRTSLQTWLLAGLALAAGAFGPDLYVVVVGMVVITSMLVPPLLPPLVRRAEPGISPPAEPAAVAG